MKWKRAVFKERDVWVGVNDQGQPVVDGGRVPIRYSRRSGAKIYRAGASRVAIAEGGELAELPDGVSADDAPKKGTSSKAGTSRRGSGFGKAGTRTSGQAAAARAEAQRLLAELPETVVVAFTDGACRGNPGPAGSGVVIRLTDGRTVEGCRSVGQATNNVAELTAIGLALDMLESLEVPADHGVALLTDSDYSHGVLCRGWKAKANRELILGLRERLSQRPGLAIHWIAGHTGVEGNERADALANLGVAGQSWVREPSE